MHFELCDFAFDDEANTSAETSPLSLLEEELNALDRATRRMNRYAANVGERTAASYVFRSLLKPAIYKFTLIFSFISSHMSILRVLIGGKPFGLLDFVSLTVFWCVFAFISFKDIKEAISDYKSDIDEYRECTLEYLDKRDTCECLLHKAEADGDGEAANSLYRQHQI